MVLDGDGAGRTVSKGVLYYAAGGGHGHVLRGLAVLSRLGRGLLVGPSRLACWAAAAATRYAALPDEGDAERVTETRSRWLRTLPVPDLLVVDVFPRGVVGEVAEIQREVPTWLVTRHVPAEFYRHAPIREALRSFELVIWTEPPTAGLADLGVPAATVPPVLLGPKPLCREEARRQLGVADGEPLLLTIGTGGAEQQRRLLRLTHRLGRTLRLATRFVSTDISTGDDIERSDDQPGRERGREGSCRLDVVSLFPLARWLPAADVVVSAGGYHAVHEIRAAGIPAIFIPQWRRYDDQAARVRGDVVAVSPNDLEDRVRDALARPRGVPKATGLGAEIVAGLLERRMEKGILGEEEIAAIAGGVGTTGGEGPSHAL